MMKRKIIALIAIGILFAFSSLAQGRDPSFGRNKEEAPEGGAQSAFSKGEASYRIYPGDVVEFNVYGAPGMHNPPFKLRVSETGTVSFPLLGEVKIAGLTEVEATQKLDTMLMDGYLADPQVTLLVLERSMWGVTQRQFSISGAVVKPGKYPVEAQITLVDAVNAAEGLAPEAIPSQVKVIREEAGEEREYVVDLYEQGLDFDIILRDKIIVESYGTYFIYGQVMKPGEYPLSEDLTVARAVVQAEGFTDIASTNGVKVIRKLGKGKTKVIKVPVGRIFQSGNESKDVPLQDGDIVVVPESWF